MKSLLFLLALVVTTGTFCQNDEAFVDRLTQDFTQKLSERGLDHYFTAKRYCSGKIEMFQIGREKKLCSSKGTYYAVYIVWKEDDMAMLKKIDNCGMHYSVALEDTEIFDFFDTHREMLKTEEVKNYKSASYTGIPELRKNPQPCFRSYSFTDNEITSSKNYNLFDVSKDGETDNLNYQHNRQLKVIALDAKLDAVLAAIENKMRRQI